MALIRPCADLRNNYNEISRICHETKQPIYITKNGTNDLVVLSDETYENIIKKSQIDEEEKINKLISKHFEKYYSTFEEFQKDFFKKIQKALDDVENGNYQTIEEFCSEMEEKYDFK